MAEQTPVSAVAPVVPGVEVAAVPQKPDPIQAQYELAVQARDPVAMMDIARKTLGSPISQAAVEAASTMERNGQQYDSIVKPIQDAGGINTPEGRLKAADTWKTVKDNPQWGTYLVETLLGNPNARLAATGGTITTKYTFDDAGKMFRVDANELGEIVRAFDIEGNRDVGRQEFSQRKAGQSSLENTLYRKSQLINNEIYAKRFAENQVAEGEWGAAADQLHSLYDQKKSMLSQLHGTELNDKEREELYKFTTRQIGSSSSISSGFNALDQFSQNKGVGMTEDQKKKAGAAASMLGLGINAQGEIINGKNEKVSKDALKNLQESFNKNNGFEQNYNQTREDALRSAAYQKLGLKEKQIFDSILEIDRNIERKTAELSSKYGTPSFLVTPSAMAVGDQYARGQVQAEMGKFNSAAIQAYNDWKADKIAEYQRAGQTPTPGELQQAFMKTDLYKNLKNQYMEESANIRRQPIAMGPVATETAPEGVKPTQAPVVGKAPPPKPTEQAAIEERRAALRAKHRTKD